MSSSSFFNQMKNYLAKHYGNNQGKMLIHTGVIGWILSSAAQVAAIITNDKISKEQKMYLIPQELADACVNILSFYLITQTCKSVASKAVNCGKIIRKTINDHLVAKKIPDVGKKTFDILRDGQLTPELTKSFLSFRNGIDFAATTTGSILSCNIVTPIIRNEIATYKQQEHLSKQNKNNPIEAQPIPNNYFPRPSFQAFQTGSRLSI